MVCVLLGSARGSPDEVAALHGSRLEMLLQRIIDTPVRGFAFEAAGTVEQHVLRDGARIVRDVCTFSRIPYALLDAPSRPEGAWPAATADHIDGLLQGRSVDRHDRENSRNHWSPLL